MTQILLIDDDSIFRMTLSRRLRHQGYEVSTAADGKEGIEMAKQLRPALILCDWAMPESNGLKVCRAIKSDPDLSTIFFILLTAYGETSNRIQGFDTGADGFLSKPLNFHELNAYIRAGLRINQLTQDLTAQKQTLEVQLTEGADYVRSLLPSPIKEPPLHVDTRFIPSIQLGGDCFNFYQLDPDYWAIYLLDVSGHGIGAAMHSVSVLNLLRSQSLPRVNYYQPNHVLTALNEAFPMSDHNNRYFTIWYGVYNQTTRRLMYASAGHPPAVLISEQSSNNFETQQLGQPGLPIGFFPNINFKNGFCDVAEGSNLYVFSDGIYEIQQSNGEMWSLDAFISLLVDYRKRQSLSLDEVLKHITSLNADNSFSDDLSLLEIQFD